ncbi:formylglycine-generating enzyme required for sulfatase activity [Paenibacillus sp. OAE614]
MKLAEWMTSLGEYPMMRIPEGDVALRDDRVKRSWNVKLDAFFMAPVPVTNAFYDAVLQHKTRTHERVKAPVTGVSWYEAVSFCNTLSRQAGLEPCYEIADEGELVVWNREADGYRLPTEAEWQHACKAGSQGYRYGELEEVAWFQENSDGMTHEVGGKLPNAWGLYDMLGNVWEWCWDLYDIEVYGSYRIFRGGSWAEEARGCGATCRRRSHPTFQIDDLGFRLARSIFSRNGDGHRPIG